MVTQKSILFFIFFTKFSLFLPSLCRAHLPVQSSTSRHEPEVIQSEPLMAELFQQWREKHGRMYDHADETLKRYENFKRNLKFIVDTNTNHTGFTVGLNRFADLSNEEFKEKYFGKWRKPVRVKGSQTRKEMSCDAPKSLDWRKKGVVTPVKNQGSCGGCWAFSSTGAIEGINAINNGELVSLSEQELIDCDTNDKGCDGGNMDNAYEWVLHNGGIDTEADYPYVGTGGSCKANKVASKFVTIDGYEDVGRSETSLLCATVNQPVSVGIQGSSIDFQLYTGGIYDGLCSSSPNDIDHAVLIVGYGSENGKDYWIVKNSWGTSWGMNGYMHLRRNTDIPNGVCGVNLDASYPTQTSSSPSPYSPPSSPQPPPPPYSPPPPRPSPPPPSPAPTMCGDFSYCPAGQTCCCIAEFFDYCLIYGCCEYTNAVCCADSGSCCPQEYPVCDNFDGFCLKKSGDILGVSAKKKKYAKHKLPWSNKFEQGEEMINQPLQWKRNKQFVAMR